MITLMVLWLIQLSHRTRFLYFTLTTDNTRCGCNEANMYKYSKLTISDRVSFYLKVEAVKQPAIKCQNLRKFLWLVHDAKQLTPENAQAYFCTDLYHNDAAKSHPRRHAIVIIHFFMQIFTIINVNVNIKFKFIWILKSR